MTATDAAEYVIRRAAAVLAGKPLPPAPVETHIPIASVEFGLNYVVDRLEQDLAGLPARVSDDPAQQEPLRRSLQAIVAELRAKQAALIAELEQRACPH